MENTPSLMHHRCYNVHAGSKPVWAPPVRCAPSLHACQPFLPQTKGGSICSYSGGVCCADGLSSFFSDQAFGYNGFVLPPVRAPLSLPDLLTKHPRTMLAPACAAWRTRMFSGVPLLLTRRSGCAAGRWVDCHHPLRLPLCAAGHLPGSRLLRGPFCRCSPLAGGSRRAALTATSCLLLQVWVDVKFAGIVYNSRAVQHGRAQHRHRPAGRRCGGLPL